MICSGCGLFCLLLYTPEYIIYTRNQVRNIPIIRLTATVPVVASGKGVGAHPVEKIRLLTLFIVVWSLNWILLYVSKTPVASMKYFNTSCPS